MSMERKGDDADDDFAVPSDERVAPLLRRLMFLPASDLNLIWRMLVAPTMDPERALVGEAAEAALKQLGPEARDLPTGDPDALCVAVSRACALRLGKIDLVELFREQNEGKQP